MALEIAYFGGADGATKQCYGIQVGRATVTLTGSSADAGTRPPNASFARFLAGENCIVSNGGDVSAGMGVALNAGQVIELECPRTGEFKARTA